MLGIWLGPYALSLYHTEAGGRALDGALAPVFPDRLAPEQIVDAERLQAGVTHLQEAFHRDPSNVEALRLLARAYLSQGNPEAALEALQQALAVRPENPLLYLELGDVYDALGEMEAAIEAYETGRVGSRGVPLAANYLKLADVEMQAGGGDVAIGLWRKTLAMDPGNLYALYRLAEIHRAMGDERQAAAYEEQLRYFELPSVAVPRDFRLAEYQAQAMAALVEDGTWERDTLLNVVSYQVWQFAEGVPGLMAERVLQRLLEQRPEDADLLFYLAELYQRRGELDRAEVAYKQVLAVDPDYAQAYLRLGMVSESANQRVSESRDSQRLVEAADWYGQYYEMAPDDLLGLKRLTEVYEALGRPEAATLREELEAKTDDRRIVAEMLGVPVEDVELGPNLVENGGFEKWMTERPKSWIWSVMFGAGPFSEAAFAGGSDGQLPFEGQWAARVDGFWVQAADGKYPARAGFWQWDEARRYMRSITLTVSIPYLLGFQYRTERVPDGEATVWVSGNADVFLSGGDYGLPATDGEWRYFVAVGWNRSSVDAVIQPLVRSFMSGSVEFDNVQLRPVRFRERTVVAVGETQFWVTGEGD
jgi:tetratricopeptide (TPR) repeat protein